MTNIPDPLNRIDHGKINRQCKRCGRHFKVKVNGAGWRYCSRTCMIEAKRAREQTIESAERRHRNYIARRYGAGNEPYSGPRRCSICLQAIEHGNPRPGKVGLVCARCSKGLAFLNDDVRLLRRAVAYFEG